MTDGDTALQMLQQAPDALFLVDHGGRIIYVNAAVTTLFGYSPADLLGEAIEQLVPDSSRGIHERYRQGFFAAPSTREMGGRIVALTARRKDGSEFPAEIRLAPLRVKAPDSASGDCVLAAVRDVTDRRRISDELRAARAEADSANKTKSRFLATASHDLRQPLQTLQLLSEALARRLNDAPSLDLIQRQQAALGSMADLLNALLDVTRLESGALTPNLEVVSLATVLADLERQFKDAATARNLTLRVSPTTECLLTDRVLFRQILQNLFSNALQYTRDGGVTVTVERNAGYLCIAIADTGVGIPAAELDRIFDEYYRGETPGIRSRGFGLGLTIVRQIARLLGYVVKVESEVLRGTTFTVQVPAEQLVAVAAASVGQPGLARDRPTAPKPAVLVIEDDAAVRDALELVLTLEGYPVWAADSAAAAQETFARHGGEIDVVISDFHLGSDRNGLEVLDELRAMAGRDLPAVILSGDTSPLLATIESVARVVLLHKPVDARQLVRKLEELFGSAG
jgi:PAS domain S-box-containing protein